ncbi:CDP-glucose 4,6-dehydratase [Gammaproteobacteria bacterium]|nr:CDP-glucose 4,6-dehydratase [Gammaproteobacteria bacterium]
MLSTYNKKKVIVTGHTGFKGSWLCSWLIKHNAEVYGISDSLVSSPSNYEACNLTDRVNDIRLNLLNKEELFKAIKKIEPDFIFHLGAQALVRPSYEDPLLTINTNAIGTANLVECLRILNKKVTLVSITSDKSYDNIEQIWGYKETDRLGGKDPYSASKAMAELVLKTYFHSFFNLEDSNVKIAITRAGNVIGGGDWAKDRIVPDCVTSWSQNKTVEIRNPNATRPWQHVLEPLGGYLLLGAHLYENPNLNGEAFNFGPAANNNYSVMELINEMKKNWGNVSWEDKSQISDKVYEATLLRLNCEKAQNYLNWTPILNFEETVEMTTSWYRNYYEQNLDLFNFNISQIDDYENKADLRGASWVKS